MIKRFFASALLMILVMSLSAQVPQGFNYQAIAADQAGQLLVSQSLPVRIGITSDLAGTIYVWEEEHATVTTDAKGMFSLVVGNPAAVKVQGSAASFSVINWLQGPLYLRTKLFHGGTWHDMGGSQLWSVPYAMVSGQAAGFDGIFTMNGDTVVFNSSVSIGSGTPGKALLSVTGYDDTSGDPLFEVRRKDGTPVFTVYNEGVRVYVGDSDSKASKSGFAIGSFDRTKGAVTDLMVVNRDSVRIYLENDASKASKGGFAIGSFDRTKGLADDYLRVSRDSVRIYLDSDPSKASKGGFAIGSFDRTKSSSSSFFDISPTFTRIINPSEPRILWYPLKNAFLAGQVLITDPALVGTNSMSIGYETSAQGEYSQALGYQAVAVGDYSTSIGKSSQALGENSFAFGNSATATQNNSYAFGGGARATGLGSYAFGSVEIDTVNVIPTTNFTTASGNYSFAIGLGANSSGQMGISLGNRSQAVGRGATAIGSYSRAEGNYSLALGDGGTATGDYALSYRGSASGPYSVAIGGSSVMTLASGSGAVAIGSGEFIAGMPPVITRTAASGSRSVAIGSGVTASGDYATVMGRDSEAQAFNSFVIGRHNIVSGSQTSWVDTDPLFVIGNGTSTTPANAVTVLKNGNVGIGTANPSTKLEITGTAKVDGTFQVTGTASMEQNLEVTGTAKFGVNGTPVQSIIKYTSLRTYVNLPAGQQRAEVFTVPDVATGSTVHVSPRSQLPVGVIIAYARVPSAGSVEVMLFNASGSLAEIGTVFLDITIIR